MTPLVSIIMPAYNCEKYITEAIASVVNQTYPSWELIVIDDGSQDNTVNIVKGLVLKDKRINLYQNERNMGVSKTRNKGISVAKGQWIAFLDSDDCWAPEKLQRQLCISEEHKEAEFIFSASRFMDENGGLFKWIMPVPEVVTYRDLLKHNVISCSSVLISRQCLGNHRMISDAIHEDFALWLEILKNEEFDCILSDHKMPLMDGVEFLKRVNDIQPKTMRLLVTAYSDVKILIDAINYAKIYRYIKKPYSPDELVMIVESALETYQLKIDNENLITDLQDLFSGTVKAIIEALDAKDTFTSGRSKRVAFYALKMVNKLALKPYTGLYLRVNLLGKVKETDEFSYDGETEKEEYDYSLFDKDEMGEDGKWKRCQIGWQIGATLDINKFNVGIGYALDFNEIAEKTKTSKFAVRVGYNF